MFFNQESSAPGDIARLLLRIAVGGLMLFHGVDKLRNGIAGIEGMLTANGLPSAMAYGVYVGEVIAPLLILVGFFTRPAALVLAFNMIVAVLLAHRAQFLSMGEHGSYALEVPAFYFLTATAVALLGAGRYSASRGRGRWD